MNFKQRALDFLETEWGTYVERFNRLPVEEGKKRVKEQGYEQFRDMLAHVLAWWEEGMPIILAIAENREYPRKKYDFDSFNAEAVAKYKDWNEAEFLNHFEKTRLQCLADVKRIPDEAWENKKLRGWVNGIFIHHAREHLVALSRFILTDILENDWMTYPQDVEKIQDHKAFFEKQGVKSYSELLGHIIGWWDEGARITRGIAFEPGFTWQDPNTDEFNIELAKQYANISREKILDKYEASRKAILDLIILLPEESLRDSNIESWLMADVVWHYDGHNPHV